MTKKVLIIGGCGQVGRCIAADLRRYTDAAIAVTTRQSQLTEIEAGLTVLPLDLADRGTVATAIAAHDLVIHCAGPFRYRDDHVLRSCIAAGGDYLDIADNPDYVTQAQALSDAAQAAGITAIQSTGVFPGLSNLMARQGAEALDQVEHIQLNYVVDGSGGAGVTVLRTTFLELQQPINAWINGQRQPVAPYSQRQPVEFPPPYGPCAVYWFNTIEALTLPQSLSAQTVVTKFGSRPDIYNHLTWLMARLPQAWLTPTRIETLAQISYAMTQVSDRFSGTGIAMRVDVTGQWQGQPTTATLTFTHPDTATAVGAGTGLVAQQLLAGYRKPGVWPIEQALPPAACQTGLHQRDLTITLEHHPGQTANAQPPG